jgi:hypothetical protein
MMTQKHLVVFALLDERISVHGVFQRRRDTEIIMVFPDVVNSF